MGNLLYKCCGCLCTCCYYYFCCHCSTCNVIHNNSVGAIPEKKLKLLLLGLTGSGKTEIAHQLAQIERHDYQTTNGVRHYNIKRDGVLCSLTEIGGNEDMQKIWHHYYVSTMGLIYCFDMSATYGELKDSFEILRNVLTNICMRGKPVLMVATKSDLADESVQLYDIENEFQIETMTTIYGNTIKLCHSTTATDNSNTNFWLGVDWLIKYLRENFDILQMRLNCDKNIQKWEKQRNKLVAEGKLNLRKYRRFPRTMGSHKFWRYRRGSHIRPHTAPPTTVFVMSPPSKKDSYQQEPSNISINVPSEA